MNELGKRAEVFNSDLLEPMSVVGRPNSFPVLKDGKSLVCGYDQGLGERLIVCDSLEDMQELYDAYAAGGALRIKWYTGDDVGYVMSLNPETGNK